MSVPMNQDEIVAAIAEQQEHEKRMRSCMGQVGRPHAFRPFGIPARPAVRISCCTVCGVTETAADYRQKVESRQ